MNTVRTTGAPVAQTAAVWRNRNFRWMWFGSTVSWFGSEIGELALPLLAIVTLTASPSEVGVLRGAQFLPFLLATLPLGVLVDRRRRRPLMIGADAGRFLLVGAIPIAVWAGIAEMEMLYVVVFMTGVLTVLYQLADFAFLPRVVVPEQLVDANGRLAASQSAAEISGKGIGGVLVQALSAPIALVADAVSYLISAVSLRSLTTVEPAPPATTDHRSPWRYAVGGLRVVVRNEYVRPLLGEAATFNFFNEIFVLGLLLYTARDLGMGPGLIGLIFTGGGVGSFLGAWFGARATGRFGYGRVLLVTLFLGNTAPAASVAATGKATTSVAVLVAAFFVMGVGIGIANVHAVSLRQMAIPKHQHGRVNAGYRLISWGAIPLGAAAGGLLATAAGAYGAMLVGAFGIPLATLWVAASAVPRLRTIGDAHL